ncbi:amino acid ABC transporter permease [Agromyces cerinus]|uniref:Amino acid ABC transporter membrane protein, PAAT family n=1 Tax=Agromyces cerinus subsp. cerinus TaxID=232089 RepID=A0A1N6I0G4_9MICO|nr:amino acid ABC transporter permease [Agromyces cerinus]SIO25385.1 amino acid ABC transporter membrane protein, PAAT family [Agromyces cerinus subsp. cerinus]
MNDASSGRTETSVPAGGPGAAPVPTKIVRLRHPWRIAFAVVILAIVAVVVIDAAQRPAFDWPTVGKYLFDQRISQAAGYTLLLTVLSMVIGVVLGIILAVMRQSENPVLKGVAWVWLWIFRGTPVYVQLVFWGLLATIYTSIDLGVPFMEPWVSFPTTALLNTFWLAVIGLALNESAYMAEIVRAGLLSVDSGQSEAATALGMGWGTTMRRVVLPQAMRVIIPPTGNEVISMLKTTSLVSAIPFTLELYMRQRDIAAAIFAPVPLLIVASIWYLAITSVLMVGQYFLEKRFARGVGDRPDTGPGPVTGAMSTDGLEQVDPEAGLAARHGGDAR